MWPLKQSAPASGITTGRSICSRGDSSPHSCWGEAPKRWGRQDREEVWDPEYGGRHSPPQHPAASRARYPAPGKQRGPAGQRPRAAAAAGGTCGKGRGERGHSPSCRMRGAPQPLAPPRSPPAVTAGTLSPGGFRVPVPPSPSCVGALASRATPAPQPGGFPVLVPAFPGAPGVPPRLHRCPPALQGPGVSLPGGSRFPGPPLHGGSVLPALPVPSPSPMAPWARCPPQPRRSPRAHGARSAPAAQHGLAWLGSARLGVAGSARPGGRGGEGRQGRPAPGG